MERSDRAIGTEIAALRKTLRILRAPGGCPWDRERDIDDMVSYLIEESYELLQAETKKDWLHVEEELGDVFFIIIFIHELMLKRRNTPLSTIVRRAHEKIVTRHPHVFGDSSAANSTESTAEWERMKRAERRKRPAAALLSNVPPKLPPVRRAAAVQKKAAGVGFDWPEVAGILDKLHEEIDEFTEELRRGGRARIKEELGDILFAVVNLARFLQIDAESVLEGTTERFVKRFGEVERRAKRSGRNLSSMSLDEMERLWQESKKRTPARAKRVPRRGAGTPARSSRMRR
jgi:tetrapyrrole methylase family protein/MazG family protein